jgi:hypothetical protein
MSAQLDRLHVRLGRGDQIVEAYAEMGVALMHLRNVRDGETHDEQWWDKARDRGAAAYPEYVKVSYERAGSELYPD